MIVLYILLFILCLSVLIVVHELGHLSMAKAFNVYCFDFSIGLGPRLFGFKRKGKETSFNVRAIPFGGFVSMYGEAETVPEGMNIDPSRSLTQAKKYKQALILSAGVIMNVILGILIFFISETCCMQTEVYANKAEIKESTPASLAGLTNDSKIVLDKDTLGQYGYYVVDGNGLFSYSDSQPSKPVAVALFASYSSFDDRSWDDHLVYFDASIMDSDNIEEFDALDLKETNLQKVDFKISVYTDENNEVIEQKNITLNAHKNIDSPTYYFDSIGLTFYRHNYWNSFPKALNNTFRLTGDSAIAIFKGLGAMFTSPQQLSGIIGVGVVTTNSLKNFGIGTFLRMWGLVSINLAVVNLLPFPGLDGWQLLVLAVESITRKKIPMKVKGIVSFVGIALLVVLMVVLIVKDIFVFF